MHRMRTRLRLRNGAAFSPGDLFEQGEQGVWFDPSDMTTLFQDGAGTVPVTAADQPVGRMLDKSGRGNHATQVTAGSRPLLRNSGALWWLEFDGVDDFLATGSIAFVSDKILIGAGIRKTSDAAVGAIMEFSAAIGSNNGTFNMLGPGAAAAATVQTGMKGTTRKDVSTTAIFAAPITLVVAGQGDIAAGTSRILVNDVQRMADATGLGTGTFGNFPLYIGMRAGTSLPFAGNLYGMIVRETLSSNAEVTSMDRYLGAQSGVAI
ncbi:MAG TPA: hypothetical protein VJ889_30905 [Pseudomonas sp.]|nr:hypothetical protein [Pseudomonas sp.]